jgi:hypothetical protein
LVRLILDSTDHESSSASMVDGGTDVNTRSAVDDDESVVKVPHLANFDHPPRILCDEDFRLGRNIAC